MSLRRLLVLLAVICLVAPFLAAQSPTDTPRDAQTIFSSASNGYTLSIAFSGPAIIGVGRTNSLLATVTPIGGYSQPVALSCDKLPPETTCAFDLPTIPAGGGATTLVLVAAAPHDCDSTKPYFYGTAGLSIVGPSVAALLLFVLPRKRPWMRSLLVLIAICGATSLTGCGTHCTDLGTRPGNYSFVVHGVAQNTVALSLGDLVNVPITVQVND